MKNPIHIKEPYWSAWKRYGWERLTAGVGISKNYVDKKHQDREMIYLTLGKLGDKDAVYSIHPDEVMKIKDKYNSVYVARENTTLYVVPFTSLKLEGGEK